MGCRDIKHPIKVTVLFEETRVDVTVNTMLLLPTVDCTFPTPDKTIASTD